MIFQSWRGVVGVIKPTYRPGSLEEFIRLLPEGIGVIPLFIGIKAGRKEEFQDAMATVEEKIDELARLKVDLIHPEGAPFFIQKGYKGEKETIRDLEKKYGIPMFTSSMALIDAARALGIKKMLIITYTQGEVKDAKVPYFTEAGFDVVAIEAMSVPFTDVGRLSPLEVYAFTKQAYLRHQEAQGILLSGSGWRILDIIQVLEQDLQVPVVQAVTARVWEVQKRLYVRQPVKGYGRLLEEMPS